MTRKCEMAIAGHAVPVDDCREMRNPANTEEVVGLAPIANTSMPLSLRLLKQVLGSRMQGWTGMSCCLQLIKIINAAA